MVKVINIYGVFVCGEDQPKAIFFSEGDAIRYRYSRFGKDLVDPKKPKVEIRQTSLESKKIYDSLPFKEGIAYFRVKRMDEEDHLWRGV